MWLHSIYPDEDLPKSKPAGVRTKAQKERARRKRKQLKKQQLLEQLTKEQQAGFNQPARCDSATQVEAVIIIIIILLLFRLLNCFCVYINNVNIAFVKGYFWPKA